jgi:hypothetical protein
MRLVYNEPATCLTAGVVRTTLPALVYTILWEPGLHGQASKGRHE